jgi:two-component system phosphate regulon sensor histidine kinase PhoR
MLSGKNTSPGQIAALTSLLISLPVSLAFLIYTKNLWVAVVALMLIFLGSMLLVRFVLERFIYRKIKLIYKFIYQTKANRRQELYYKHLLPLESIEEVSEDVENWAKEQEKEIEVLKANEVYRKEFLQNLSHELRTPIFSIQGYIENLLDGSLSDPILSRKFLENTNRNVERLVNMVNDLRVITKLESGEQPMIKENFCIQILILSTFDSLMLKAKAKQITMQIKKGCEGSIEVFADKEKISQVLTNLIENSIKYGNNGGFISAGVYVTDEKTVLIEISDNGIGIKEQHLSRIFERFYRTDDSRSRNIGGTGLGLAICKHIIEAHNQSIHVRSKPEVGTTIGFTLQGGR